MIHKQKENDGRKIKRAECSQSVSCGVNKVLSFHPITSCFFDDHNSIYTFTTPRTATLLSPSPPWQLGACTFTPYAQALQPDSSMGACAHAQRQMNSQKARWWKYAAIWWGQMGLNKHNVECHDNTDTPNCSSHSFPWGLWLHAASWQLSQTSCMSGS